MEMIPLSERTRQALDAGFTNAQLAKAAGVSSGAVSQWLTTTNKLSLVAAIGVAKLTGWRVEWWGLGTGPREENSLPKLGVAHDLSQARETVSRMPLIRMAWGDIMGDLPEKFSLKVKDDAMAPWLMRGDFAIIDTTEKPRPGAPVLVIDRDGNGFIRNYEEGRLGQFRAIASNAGYLALESEADGLRVLGTCKGRE